MVGKTGRKAADCCHFCKELKPRYLALVWVPDTCGIKRKRQAFLCENCIGRAHELVRPSEHELVSFQGVNQCGNQN